MARDPEYDVTLDGVGLVLTRDGLGVSRTQANPYAMKSSTGERTYADLDEWAVFQVSSCHRGMGQERYGDPEQFWYSIGADTRFKDKILLGPKMQAVDETGITDSGDMFFAHLDDTLFCAVDDNVYELFSVYTASTIAFVSSTKKITDTATGLINFVTGDTITVSGSTSNDGSYTIATGGVAAEIVTTEALTDENVGASITLTKASADWVSRDELADEDVKDMLAYNDYLYVSRGENSMRKSADGRTWTDVGDTPAGYQLFVHGGYLYRSYDYSLYYSSDPEGATPTWSSAMAVGSTDYGIKSMRTYQNSLIVFKNDGAWRVPGNPGDLDTAYRIPELDWRTMIHDDNGLYSAVWSDGFLYVTVGAGGLLRWTGRTVTPMGPDTLLGGPTTRGVVRGLVPTPSFLYLILSNDSAAAYGGDRSPILAWNGSGWHCATYNADTNGKALYYFDEYLYCGWYNTDTTNHEVYKAYQPQQSLDPTQDASYQYSAATGLLYSSRFTANMHGTYKEFRSITLWLDNEGGAASGAQRVTPLYRVDSEDFIDPVGTYTTVIDGGQESFTIDFDAPTFTEKQVASVDSDRDTVTLTANDVVSDLSTGDWLYFAGVNEYRYVHSTGGSVGAYTITLACPLDSAPAANTYIRPGVPVGRYIAFRISLTTTGATRTPVIRAFALKYLVNIKDFDLWQLNVQVSDPLTLRNGVIKRQPISDQLARLNEIRKKGRVAFVDEVGNSHVVKVTNYSLQPTRQRADERMEPATNYQAKLTLLEV